MTVKQLFQTPSIEGVKCERVTLNGKPFGKIKGTCYYWNTVGNFGMRGGFQAIAPMAFTSSLKKRLASQDRDIMYLRSHDSGRILARTANEKLKVWEDDEGVHYEAWLNLEDPESLGAFVLIEDGTLDASSMGYIPIESESQDMKDNSTEAIESGKDITRKVAVASECDLLEISVVGHGVYHGASALAAEQALEADEAAEGYTVVSVFNAEDVLIAQTVHRTIDYTIHTEIETEWEGEPYWSPLKRRKETTSYTETDEEVVETDDDSGCDDDTMDAGKDEDKEKSGTDNEDEDEKKSEGDTSATGSEMTLEQHYAELEELGVAAFIGSVDRKEF